MTKTHSIIRSILGPTRKSIRVLADSVDITAHLMFVEKISMDDIQLGKDIYSNVAKQLHKRDTAISRGVERLANDCWDELVKRNLVVQYLGESRKDIDAPSDMLFYLATYIYLGIPYFIAIKKFPHLFP